MQSWLRVSLLRVALLVVQLLQRAFQSVGLSLHESGIRCRFLRRRSPSPVDDHRCEQRLQVRTLILVICE